MTRIVDHPRFEDWEDEHGSRLEVLFCPIQRFGELQKHSKETSAHGADPN